MLSKICTASLVAALALPGMASAQSKQHKHSHTTQSAQQITVSCFRGPTRSVIVDRPKAVFIDGLVGLGYEYDTAYAIGLRICRDDALVGDGAALKATTKRILRETPPRRRR